MSLSQFPVFDLGAFEKADAERKRELGKQVDAICRTTGFLAIRNHGVPQAIIDAVWGKAHAFFDLPPEERLPAAMQNLGISFSQLSDVAGHA